MSGVRAIVFDLDGTLIDSALSIATALNRIRIRRGAPATLAVEEVRQWVSLGVDELVRAALAEAYTDSSVNVAQFRAEYAAIETPVASVYDGIPQTLEVLVSAGLMLAVCSNKPQHLCVKALKDTDIQKYFSVVIGGDAVTQPKPHPGHLLAALNALNVTRAESVYVGDSSVDFRVSQAAGVPFLLARYGYADPPLLELDQSQLEGFESPKDLPRVIARRMGVSRL